jgi:hypothetical protein
MKDADAAKAAARCLKRFPVGWRADQLRQALQRYEKG